MQSLAPSLRSATYHSSRWPVIVLLALALVVGACSTTAQTTQTEGVPEDSQTASPPSTGAEPDPTSASAPPAPVPPSEAALAVTTTGITNPPDGYSNFDAGVGDVYVVSSDGLAIARHHVVAGATTITTAAGPATILGWSECLDLAVIDIAATDLAVTDFTSLFENPEPQVRGSLPALTPQEAAAYFERLSAGERIDSLGLNLLSIPDRGLWVAGVHPDGSAGQVGVEPGDIVVRFDDIELWDSGNRLPFCDLLAERGDDAELDLFVNRSATGREWGATLNTGATLERTGSVYPPAGYQSIQDPFAGFFLFVPDAWQVEGGTSPFDEDDGQVAASPDIDAFLNSFDVGGVVLARSNSLVSTAIFDMLDAMSDGVGPVCHLGGSEDYDDGLYVGSLLRLVGCGPSDAEVAFFAAATSSDDHLLYGFFQLVDEADREAMRVALDSVKPQ